MIQYESRIRNLYVLQNLIKMHRANCTMKLLHDDDDDSDHRVISIFLLFLPRQN